MYKCFPDFISSTNKFTTRVLLSTHVAIRRRIAFLSDFDYSVIIFLSLMLLL